MLTFRLTKTSWYYFLSQYFGRYNTDDRNLGNDDILRIMENDDVNDKFCEIKDSLLEEDPSFKADYIQLKEARSSKMAHIDNEISNLKSTIKNIDNLRLIEVIGLLEHDEYYYDLKFQDEPDFDSSRKVDLPKTYVRKVARLLIGNQHIDASYEHLISRFYPGMLSLHDKQFMNSVLLNEPLGFDFEIKTPEIIADNLDREYYIRRASHNLIFADFVLHSSDNSMIDSYIQGIINSNDYGFIEALIRSNYYCTLFSEKLWSCGSHFIESLFVRRKYLLAVRELFPML